MKTCCVLEDVLRARLDTLKCIAAQCTMEMGETVSAAQASPAGLEQCLELLRGPQDERRYSACFLEHQVLGGLAERFE